MDEGRKQEILEAAKKWFREVIAINHVKNTEELKNPEKLNINPFIVAYLAKFLTGNTAPESIAKALLYPRVLGTSISTSFGTNLQKFIPYLKDTLKNEAKGSIIKGFDIEFIDQVSKKPKYCQLKAGVNTINSGDVESIHNHFKSARNLARTNGVTLSSDNFAIGVIYGTRDKLNGNYKRLEKEYGYDVFVGQEFWHRLTGDEKFYSELGLAFSVVAQEFDGVELLGQIIKGLSGTEEIKKISGM